MTTFVIVGGGQAGSAAAMELRRAGFEGRVVVVGEETHLPYERPVLSKSQLVDDAAVLPMLQAPDLYARQRVEFLTGTRALRLDAADRRLALSDGSTLAFDELLIATGGRARPLTLPGAEHALLLRNFDDACVLRERLRRPGRLTVIGAGVIGLEVAASAAGLGWSVTVLEVGTRAMARLVPAAIGQVIECRHRAAGVDLRFGCGVSAIAAGEDGRFELSTSQGYLRADLILAGIGMQPNIELAAQAGARVSDAILVDERGRTSLPHVHAAGDVASFLNLRSGRHVRLESWQHAARHAATVARGMLGQAVAYDEVPWSWSDQYDLNVQILGQPLDGTETVLRGRLDDMKFLALHLRDGRLVGATMVNQGREMRPCKALIESGIRLVPAQLADPATSLRALATSSHTETATS